MFTESSAMTTVFVPWSKVLKVAACEKSRFVVGRALRRRAHHPGVCPRKLPNTPFDGRQRQVSFEHGVDDVWTHPGGEVRGLPPGAAPNPSWYRAYPSTLAPSLRMLRPSLPKEELSLLVTSPGQCAPGWGLLPCVALLAALPHWSLLCGVLRASYDGETVGPVGSGVCAPHRRQRSRFLVWR